MPEEPIGDDTRIPTQESDIVDEWITSLKESLEEGTIPLSDDEMLNLEMAIMEQIDNLDNETIAQQIEYHSMVRAMATLAGDQPLSMDANQNVELWEMCAARKGFTKEWEAEGNIAFAAENTSLQADYDTTGTLSNLFKFGSGDDEAIGGFTPEELAKSSAIHGDFNQASLGYSGHQNIQLKGESFEAPMDVFNPGRTDVENSVAAVLRSAKKETGANWKLYTAFRPLYYIHTSDQGQPKNVQGVSNKFLTFFIVKKDGANVFRAYNAWARIGYTPGNNQVFSNYEGDLSNAEAALRNKIAVKTKSRRSSGEYVLRQYAEESSTGKCACGVNCVCDCGCAESGVCNCGASCPCNCGCGVKAAEDEDDWDEDSEYAHPDADYDPWQEGGEPGCHICADAVGSEEANVADGQCPRCGTGGICIGCAASIAEDKGTKNYHCDECARLSDEDAAEQLIEYSAEDTIYPSVTLAHPYKTGFKMYFGALAGAATMVIGLMGLTALLIRNKE